MDIVNFFKKRIQASETGSQGDAKVDSREAEDGFLGLKVGALVSIDKSFFATIEQSILSELDISTLSIKAASRIRIDGSARAWRRYYLGDVLQWRDLYLQVEGSESTAKFSIHTLAHREYPGTKEDLMAFQGNGYGLGEFNYSIGEAGWLSPAVPDDVKALFAAVPDEDGEGGIRYTRDLDGGEYVAPLQAREEIVLDAAGSRGELNDIRFTPYCRPLGDGIEKLEIRLVMGLSRDHQPSDQCQVDFYLGIDVPGGKIKIY